MKISDIPTPDVYRRESMDFRFFLHWFEECLQKIKYDHDHVVDLYDPLRCPKELLWMLADTMGYKYDSRLPPAFCRLVLLYFMSMIRLRGSKNGVTLAAEVNLAQHSIKKYGEENDILYNRLEDTSVPVNAVSVVPHVHEGYIEIVYFSEETPIDACLEYVRPVGMYVFARHGVTVHARTKIWVDAMLTDRSDMNLSIGPTRVGHYSREDYARMQKMTDEHGTITSTTNVNAVAAPVFDTFNEGASRFTPVAVNDDATIASVTRDSNENEIETALPTDYVVTYNDVKDEDRTIMLVVTDSVNESGTPNTVKTYYKIVVSATAAVTVWNRYRDLITGLKNVAPRNSYENEAGKSFDHPYEVSIRLIQPRMYHRSVVKTDHVRRKMWNRNAAYEVNPDDDINPGYRALYNLQMSNNHHIVESLIPKMFSLGFGPHTNLDNSPQFRENHAYSYGDTVKYQGVIYVCLETHTSSVTDPEEGTSAFDKDLAAQKWVAYLDFYEQNQDIREDRPWDIKNLRHRDIHNAFGDGWSYLDSSRTSTTIKPAPRVNPILAKIGDAIAMSPNPLEEYDNEGYTKSTDPENKGNDITVHPRSDV